MSRENVERMQGAIEAFNQRDGAALDAFLATDAEVIPVRAALEGPPIVVATPVRITAPP